jgi:hypothetical protein
MLLAKLAQVRFNIFIFIFICLQVISAFVDPKGAFSASIAKLDRDIKHAWMLFGSRIQNTLSRGGSIIVAAVFGNFWEGGEL